MALLSPPVSLAEWLHQLCPATLEQYVFTTYNGLLSWSAMALLLDEDFLTAAEQPEAAGQDTLSVANMRLALNIWYPDHTLQLWREGTRQHVTITVPGGEQDSWPTQIKRPGSASGAIEATTANPA